jgi:hypothetical protein
LHESRVSIYKVQVIIAVFRRKIMRVLVSDNLGEAGIKMFEEEEGIELDVNTGLSHEELKGIIGKYDALVIRSATKVTEDLLEAATRLKVVGRAGIGLDNVDIPAATKRGVVVMNTPGGNVITTAEHAIAMILSLSRNIPDGTASLKAGKWDKKRLQGRESTLGDTAMNFSLLKKMFVIVVVALSVNTWLAVSFASAQDKPNILVIWGDDVGRSNISAYTMGLVG